MPLANSVQLVLLVQKSLGWVILILLLFRILCFRLFKRREYNQFLSVIIFFLAVLHVLAYIFFIYKSRGVLDPFYPFLDLCLICKNVFYPEYLVNFGRLALWVLGFWAISVVFGWKKFWLLYVLVFLLGVLHALGLRLLL